MRIHCSNGTTARLVARLLAVATIVAPIVAPMAGCFRPHLTQPVEIEVFDAITGEAVAGASVVHGAPTGKFEPSLHEDATADAAGVATIDSLRLVDDAWWQLARSDAPHAQRGPYYNGTGWSQIPSEFEPVASPARLNRYRAPLWPDIWMLIEVPIGFRGLLSWYAFEADLPVDAGWIPPAELLPARLEQDASFRAVVRPDPSGTVAHPTAIAGVRGYEPTNFSGDDRVTIMWTGGEHIESIGAESALTVTREVADPAAPERKRFETTPRDPLPVRAWRLWPQRIPGAPITYGGVSYAWFIGTLDELRTWLRANELRPLSVWGTRVDTDDPAVRRVYAAHKLLPLVPRAKEPSSPPMWSVRRGNAG